MTKPTIITRAEWGAREPRSVARAPTDQGIICHHTTGTMRVKPELAKEEMRAMQRYHQMEKGWADIGYHYVIDGAGRIYEGRGAGVGGAHCPGRNRTHLGIALMGNFEHSHPTDEQIDALVHLCRHFCEAHGHSAANITAHRDHRATDCPGENLYVQMNDIRERIATGTDSLVADVAPMEPRPLADLDDGGSALEIALSGEMTPCDLGTCGIPTPHCGCGKPSRLQSGHCGDPKCNTTKPAHMY